MMKIAIVTCCHNYGRYLSEWAASLIGMTRHPAMVAIVDACSTDDTPAHVMAAAKKLEAAGIKVRTARIDSPNIGVGRNAAVALADTEWVQHFDCDDVAMPHMLEEFERYADRADVIAAGYERSGHLAAGPTNRHRIYRDTQGEQTRRSLAPASGVSPFRRALWEQSPYREDMIGGWDTALWLGFTHLDPPARFVATRRPVFWYRQHADSTFNMRRKDSRRSALVGRKLTAIRQNYRGVSVIVPWKPDGGPRDAAWRWVRDRYAAVHPDYEVVVGECSDSIWRKGEAVANGLAKATGWTLIIADADCIVAPQALQEAVGIVETRPEVGWVMPHRLVKRIDAAATAAVISGPLDRQEFSGLGMQRPAYEGYAGGGMVVVERSRYEASGGIPQIFRGWGAEDEALAVILDTLIAPHVRLEHDLIHLWHPQERRFSHAGYQQNRLLLQQLLAYDGAPDEMWEVLRSWADGAATLTMYEGKRRRVRMVAKRSFKLGTRVMQKGATFFASPEQARRMIVSHPNDVGLTRGGEAQLADIERYDKAMASNRSDRRRAVAAQQADKLNLTRSDYA